MSLNPRLVGVVMIRRSKAIPAAALLIVLTLAAYFPAVLGGFVWDDDAHLIDNIVLQDGGLYRSWCTTEPFCYYPMVWTSFWAEHQAWGLNPLGYHLVNVLLHAASALLIWRILIRLKIPAPWFAALVFALHPVNVESVAWITQRKNTLSLLFFLVSLLSYLRFDDRGRWRSYWLALAMFVAAMLSKGGIVTLPVVLLLCTGWLRGTIGRRDVLRSIPFFVVSLLMSAVEVWFQYVQAIAGVVVRDEGFLARLAGAGWVVWFYLGKALWPTDLTFLYPRWNIDPANWASYVPGLLLLGVLGLCWRHRRNWGRPVLFGLGYFVVTLAPALGFVDVYFMRYSFVADHYQYPSIIGIIALVVAVGGAALRRIEQGGVRWPVRRMSAVAVVVVLCLATWRQCGIYRNIETLWRDTLRKNPDAWLAHNNLGTLLKSRGDFDEATWHYRQALKSNPTYPLAQANLGNMLVARGDTEQGIAMYRLALQSDPLYVMPRVNLGSALLARGDVDEAIVQYREVVRIDAGFAAAHSNLGSALLAKRELNQAMNCFQRALEIDPDLADAHNNMGLALTLAGRLAEALPPFREAARLRSGWAAPLKSAAWILATHPDDNIREPREAVRLAYRASALTGHRNAQVLDTLAVAYAAAGQFDRAATAAGAALELARETQDKVFEARIQKRLNLYVQHKPYREPARHSGEKRE